jgi:hypothetical protein
MAQKQEALSMRQGMFEYGTPKGRSDQLGVKLPSRQVWCMTSCSALSGQMAFRDVTQHYKDVDGATLASRIQETTQPWGFTHTGELKQSFHCATYADLLAKTVEVSRLLKLGVGTNPFLTVDEGYPYLTDGTIGFRIEWEPCEITLKFPKKYGHKVLRMIVDPVCLSRYGRVLSPIQPVIDLIAANEDVFCDPFADRDVGKKRVSLIRQIVPGKRQKVRTVTRGKKEATP